MTGLPEINISALSDDWRGVALSNFCLSPFVLDGVLLASVEGFIQGIKFPPGNPLREQGFATFGQDAKALSAQADSSGAYWDGKRCDYGSPEHHHLIERAIRARIAQNGGLQAVLRSTAGATIVHRTGMPESPATSLLADIFCDMLTRIRSELSSDG